MLYTPLWKRLLILALCAWGISASVPNLFYTQVEQHNDATDAIAAADGVATDAQATDLAKWPTFLPSALMNLGLDLRGGAHLLAEVQVSDVYSQRIDAMWPEVRDALKDVRAEVGAVRRMPSVSGVLRVSIANADKIDVAVAKVKTLAVPVTTLTGAGQSDIDVTAEGAEIVVQLSEAERVATDSRTMQQSLEIVRRRIDAAGTREPTIQLQGADRILIEVPGIGSAEELKALIGTTAKLTFNPVVQQTTNAAADPGPRNSLLPAADQEGLYYIIADEAVVGGDELTDSQPSFDQNGQPAVSFKFNVSGARKFGEYTGAHVNELFAIVLDGAVISAPRINQAITGGSGIITGNFSLEESTNLAVLLRAGALPAKMTFLEERTVGPELGQDSIDAGKTAAVIGIVAVGLFMIACYGLFGVFANIALVINMALIFGVLATIGGTLTLPGIGGIVLTIGMAVDANVLVFERIREELRNQKHAARAIEIGYDRAMSAIIDANLTTLITAAVLFFVGAGPVRGFAVTLGIGIITSVFSAIFVTRMLVEFWFNWRKPKTIVV
jgi:preprotein translocase subunit SecD